MFFSKGAQCMSQSQVKVLKGQIKESCKATLYRCMHHMYAKSSCRTQIRLLMSCSNFSQSNIVQRLNVVISEYNFCAYIQAKYRILPRCYS